MIVYDFFSGMRGWSEAFEKRGHKVVAVDNNEKFKTDVCMNMMHVEADYLIDNFGSPDVILASPPCNKYSVASVYKYWVNGRPKDEVHEDIELLAHTMSLIIQLNPRYWVLENPRGMMRKILGKPQYEITQCQYGREVMKPTDLWGYLPKYFKPRKCNNRDKCHQSAPRSSVYGTQGIGINQEAFKKNKFAYMVQGGGGNSALRAKIPYGLSKDVCLAIERAMK